MPKWKKTRADRRLILGYITDLGDMIESIVLFFFPFDFVTRNPLQVAGVDKTDIDSPPGVSRSLHEK
ncbi:hypothetical protein I7I53_06777 [Histoplasma capsulatum var. duboisii H88]|uniref:Uncharacterized protein n=1 Tax=Ajellomyces capsulatus (strain H88) TaxID=544711 RepID=A0A8A1LCG2_AJEC8|nr:hypothetical protein I7I53_06777 [Histoplasma capsulatum var. duboisii H88]